MYASIVKFPPSGGAIWYGADQALSPSVTGTPPADVPAKPTTPVMAHIGFKPQIPAQLQGALWCRFGFAPYSLGGTGGDTCMCEGPGFDVDGYGRVFYPNVGQFRVEVVDANNNMIGTFGQYGNQDSGGKDALAKKPDIPLAWPLTVAVSDTHAYVADTVNLRVVKVKVGYAAEESCLIAP